VLLCLIWLLLVACQPTPPPATDTLKLSVATDGLYRLSGADLQQAGLNPAFIGPKTLQLTHQGHSVPLLVEGQGRDALITFYGVAADTRYTGTNVYWLHAGEEAGLPMPERPVQAPARPPQTVVPATVHREENSYYWAKDPMAGERPSVGDRQAGDWRGTGGQTNWYWQALIAPVTVTLTFTLPERAGALSSAASGTSHSGPRADAAELRVAFLGGTRGPYSPNHRVIARVNGQQVGELTWDGQTRQVLVGRVPEPALRDGQNELELQVTGVRQDQPDLVLLDWFEVTYPRQLVAEEDRLLFVGPGGGYRVKGFSGPEVVALDVTDPYAPVRLAGVQVEAEGKGYAASFEDAQAGRKYLLVGPTGLRRPRAMEPAGRDDLRARGLGADYVIITHPDFVAGLQPLIAWRESQGLRVATVTINQTFDAFSGGLADPAAIRDLLRHARTSWQPPPRFVLLVGEASYDYRDYLGAPNKSLVPTMMLPTTHLGEAASDNWFVSLDDGHLPVMAIGRLPVKTPGELERVVRKIVAYEKSPPAGEWRRRVLYVADDKDPVFVRISEALAADLPPDFQAERLFMEAFRPDLSVFRARLLAEWDHGAAVVNYIGHGALRSWAAEKVFEMDDVARLRNGGRLPVLVTPTCLDGFFAHPQEDSLTEELLLRADGGIIAGFVPTGLTPPSQQEPLVKGFYRALLHEGTTLGEAILEAKRALPNAGQGYEDAIETFVLLGDPATKLVRGE